MAIDIWGLAAIATKFAIYLGVLASLGTVLAALIFRIERYNRSVVFFAVLGLCGALLSFSLRGAMLTGDARGMIDPEMLQLLWSTPTGTALTYRLLGLALVLLGLIGGRPGLILSTVGGVLAVWSFAQVGHISDRGATFPNAVLTLHLLAIAFWIGILSPLKRLTKNASDWPQAAEMGHQFGKMAAISVPILLLAGGVLTYLLAGSFNAMFATGYGQTLLLKVGFVGALITLGAANKLRFIPELKTGNARAARHLANSITIEWAVVIIVLAITATLTSSLALPT